MSLQTWKKEFYPIEAGDTEKRQSVEHSLQKWNGVLPKNLKKHGLKRSNAKIFEDYGDAFELDMDSCSLCTWFYNDAASSCSECPLHKSTGKTCGIHCHNQYDAAIFDGKIQGMINALKKARKFL